MRILLFPPRISNNVNGTVKPNSKGSEGKETGWLFVRAHKSKVDKFSPPWVMKQRIRNAELWQLVLLGADDRNISFPCNYCEDKLFLKKNILNRCE